MAASGARRPRLRLRRGDPGAREALAEVTALALRTGELQRLGPVAAVHAEAAWHGQPDADVALAAKVMVQARAAGSAREMSEIAFWLALQGHDLSGVAPNNLEPALTQQLKGDWANAAATWAGLGCAFEQAITRFHSGDKMAIHGALAQLSALGATATIERLHAGLRSRGLRAPDAAVRGPRATTAAHPAGLTQREAEVLVLMAQGLTNGEIASRIVRSAKTVDHHVSAVLSKLGARSRAEASAQAVRLGLLDVPIHGAVPARRG